MLASWDAPMSATGGIIANEVRRKKTRSYDRFAAAVLCGPFAVGAASRCVAGTSRRSFSYCSEGSELGEKRTFSCVMRETKGRKMRRFIHSKTGKESVQYKYLVS